MNARKGPWVTNDVTKNKKWHLSKSHGYSSLTKISTLSYTLALIFYFFLFLLIIPGFSENRLGFFKVQQLIVYLFFFSEASFPEFVTITEKRSLFIMSLGHLVVPREELFQRKYAVYKRSVRVPPTPYKNVQIPSNRDRVTHPCFLLYTVSAVVTWGILSYKAVRRCAREKEQRQIWNSWGLQDEYMSRSVGMIWEVPLLFAC